MLEQHARTLVAAQGYSELSMFDDAIIELDSLPEEAREHPTSIELRLVILMQARRWPAALAASHRLCELIPEKVTGYIHAAFACMNSGAQRRHAISCSKAPRLCMTSRRFTTISLVTNVGLGIWSWPACTSIKAFH
jgi:hypothetical protein